MSVSSLELALLFTMMIYDGCVRNWILEKAGGGEGRAKKRNELSHIFSSHLISIKLSRIYSNRAQNSRWDWRRRQTRPRLKMIEKHQAPTDLKSQAITAFASDNLTKSSTMDAMDELYYALHALRSEKKSLDPEYLNDVKGLSKKMMEGLSKTTGKYLHNLNNKKKPRVLVFEALASFFVIPFVNSLYFNPSIASTMV